MVGTGVSKLIGLDSLTRRLCFFICFDGGCFSGFAEAEYAAGNRNAAPNMVIAIMETRNAALRF
jgi:hypothetical protein